MATPPCSTTALSKKQEGLRLLINSRSPLITVETGEEERFTKLLAAVASDLSIGLYTEVLNDILDAKRTALQSTGSLETVKRDASFNDVAGLTHLREWISQRKSAWTPEGQKFGRVPPKGSFDHRGTRLREKPGGQSDRRPVEL